MKHTHPALLLLSLSVLGPVPSIAADAPDFARDVAPVLTNYCTGCHSSELEGPARHDAPADHDFDTLDGIREVMDHIDQFAAFGPESMNANMPPYGSPKPSTEEREMLGEWLACGAPE